MDLHLFRARSPVVIIYYHSVYFERTNDVKLAAPNGMLELPHPKQLRWAQHLVSILSAEQAFHTLYVGQQLTTIFFLAPHVPGWLHC